MNQLQQLCTLSGVSGDESAVRDYIIEQVKDHCSYQIDPLGNLICQKIGSKTPQKKLMISAHMDEVGLIVTAITSDGFLKFDTVGGIDRRVLVGRSVRVAKNGIVGVIGTKAMHQQSAEEREKAVTVKQMSIDIGATSTEQAEEYVALGDTVVFDSTFEQFGDGFVKGKALDDRIGCDLLIDLIKTYDAYDFTATFVVQEEVGLRGAKVAAYTVNPDLCIVLETTTAADIAGVSGEKCVCKLGDGAVVSFMDRSTIYPKQLFDLAFAVAKQHDLPCQTKTMVAGGNDAGAIHVARGGVQTLAVSLPCRYLHSATCVIKAEDYHNTKALLPHLMDNMLG